MHDLVLTMAGRGQRFVDAGNRVPKAAITARGHTLLWWSLMSVRHLLDERSELVFVVRDEDNLAELVRTTTAELGLGGPRIVPVAETTDGQATTALIGAADLSHERPFFVYNADTHVRPGRLRAPDQGDAWIPYFVAEGTAWSFVDVDASGRVRQVAEKRRISANATLGLYSFPSGRAYRELYDECFLDGKTRVLNGERYIAPMYQVAIDGGWVVMANPVDQQDVVPLGTPREVEAFEADWRQSS